MTRDIPLTQILHFLKQTMVYLLSINCTFSTYSTSCGNLFITCKVFHKFTTHCLKQNFLLFCPQCNSLRPQGVPLSSSILTLVNTNVLTLLIEFFILYAFILSSLLLHFFKKRVFLNLVLVRKFSPPTCSVHLMIQWIIPNSSFSFTYRYRNAMVLCMQYVFQFISKIFHGKNSAPPIISLLYFEMFNCIKALS